MANTTVLIDHKKLHEPVSAQHPQVAEVPKKPLVSKKTRALGQRFYHQTLETVKSILLIAVILGFSKATGFYDLWVKFIGYIY